MASMPQWSSPYYAPPSNWWSWGGSPGGSRSLWSRSENEKLAFLAARSARLEKMGAGALHKRAPDLATTTMTNTNTAQWPTVTKTFTASTGYVTIATTVTVNATITPSPVTVVAGQTTAAQVVVTAPASTRISTKYTMAWQIATTVQTHT
jgi:hypothetical protein